MSAAFAKGYVKAIVAYARAHTELTNGLQISEFDFDPYDAASLIAEPNVHTEQYTHNGKEHGKWGLTQRIADEKQRGLDDEDSKINGDNNSYNEWEKETKGFIGF